MPDETADELKKALEEHDYERVVEIIRQLAREETVRVIEDTDTSARWSAG
jgi:hypothetical protein